MKLKLTRKDPVRVGIDAGALASESISADGIARFEPPGNVAEFISWFNIRIADCEGSFNPARVDNLIDLVRHAPLVVEHCDFAKGNDIHFKPVKGGVGPV